MIWDVSGGNWWEFVLVQLKLVAVLRARENVGSFELSRGGTALVGVLVWPAAAPSLRTNLGGARARTRILTLVSTKLLTPAFCQPPSPTNHQQKWPSQRKSAFIVASIVPVPNSSLCSPHSISQKDIEVPETILKKQKANQKLHDQRAADLKKKREVR